MSKTVAPEKLARLELLLDRQDILDCLIRFCRGMDRKEYPSYRRPLDDNRARHMPTA